MAKCRQEVAQLWLCQPSNLAAAATNALLLTYVEKIVTPFIGTLDTELPRVLLSRDSAQNLVAESHAAARQQLRTRRSTLKRALEMVGHMAQ